MKILIPTDFSESARSAFTYAFQMYKGFDDVEFILLNSYEMPKGGSAGGVMMNLEEAMAKESEHDLELEVRYLSKEFSTAKISPVSRYGTLENSVARTCNENDITVVVMGTHGASGWKKALIGSNTEKVIENVSTPVIAVPKDWEFRSIKNIVYATDLQRLENPESLQPVCKVAEHYDSTIHIIYVAESASDIDLEAEVGKLPLNDIFKKRNRKFKVVESDSVEAGIDSYVKEIDADLVVLIPKAATFWQKIFKRSVTEQMCFHTRVPMLAVKDI